MTCREFQHDAAALTLWELARNPQQELLGHAAQCEACGGWLNAQRALAGSMQALQAQTAGLEAGPEVEQTLLRAFRQTMPARAAAVDSVSGAWAMCLSRWFEIGAYAAAGAAILVALFLSARLLPHRGQTSVEGRKQPIIAQPLPQSAAPSTFATASVAPRRQAASSRSERNWIAAANSANDSEGDADGYVALMLCDPLSCSSESQVVRMELPDNGNASSQPRTADVVVGYDGIVRAVRMVN